MLRDFFSQRPIEHGRYIFKEFNIFVALIYPCLNTSSCYPFWCSIVFFFIIFSLANNAITCENFWLIQYDTLLFTTAR